jgi:hypothetical protein
LGSAGMLAGQLSRSPAAGYVFAFAWYLLDWMTQGKQTGVFYLFAMSRAGEWDPDKWWLAGTAVMASILSAALHKSRMLEH